MGWLAPTTVGLALVFLTLARPNSELARLASSSNQFPVMAMSLSNMSFAAYLPGSFANDQNVVRPESFDWTNHGGSHSSMGSFLQSRTNYLKR